MTIDDTEDEARGQYQDALHSYAAALVARDPIAKELFAKATAAWERLRTLPCEEAQLDIDMHLVAALAFAVQARDACEAKRIYDSMSDRYQRDTDAAEAFEPGSLKIWL
jgi:hypothetical protein